MSHRIENPNAETEGSPAGLKPLAAKQESALQTLTAEVAQKIAWVPQESIAWRLRQLVSQYGAMVYREAPIRKPKKIRARLNKVAVTAQKLLDAMGDLDQDACWILHRLAGGFQLRWASGVFELNRDEDSLDQTKEEPSAWNRNPPLISRLEALAKVAQSGAAWVQEKCIDGNYRKCLPRGPGSAQEFLFRQCAESLGSWLLVPGHPEPGGQLFFDMDLFDQLLLLIGRRVHEIAKGAKLEVARRLKPATKVQESQWGRAAARKAKAWLFGTPITGAPLQNISED